MADGCTYGLTLANRGVTVGVTSAPELIDLAVDAESTGVFRSVFCGDSLLGNPRIDSVALLSAIASRTKRLRLGTACMASFPVRDPILLAAQWASLDHLSEGRALLVVCTGLVGGGNPGQKAEEVNYGFPTGHRAARLVESIKILKLLWTQDAVTFEGEHFKLQDVSLNLRPIQQPRPPIIISSNARGDPTLVDRTLKRVARHADGWMTTIVTPDPVPTFTYRWGRILEHARELGRGPSELEMIYYYNINVNEDRAAAFTEAKAFLDRYYTANMPESRVEAWCALGSPTECAERIRAFIAAGASEITFRLAGFDQRAQFRRLVEDVLPLVASQAVAA
jgi:alkanesulfonate monooxygenase SsuD/methylene tetrahydromethanopterin reductase-like flavin-dependent oxidoreductase (luciferase family)